MEKITRNQTLKVVSLFCGCGGMDLGLIGGFSFLGNKYAKNPYKVVYAVDNDAYATALYNNNFNHKCFTKDVKQLTSKDVPEHDLLIGGFPCKSFSIVAQNPPRLGYKDERGMLFFEMVKILKEKQPRFFIAENVKGLLSANKKKAFPMIIKEFEDAGYHVKYKVLTASHFGVPQKRERVFIIGFREFKDFIRFQYPTELTKEKAVLGDVVDINIPVDEKYFFSQKAVDGMMKSRAKMNKGRAMDLNKPCNTISSHLAKVSLNSTDPVLFYDGRYRRFTPREAADIQSFPKDFDFEGISEHRQYVAIGNAVPPVLMWHVTQSLNRILEEDIQEELVLLKEKMMIKPQVTIENKLNLKTSLPQINTENFSNIILPNLKNKVDVIVENK